MRLKKNKVFFLKNKFYEINISIDVLLFFIYIITIRNFHISNG